MTTTLANEHSTPAPNGTRTRPMTIGVVNFLNTLPLIQGLEDLENIKTVSAVPSALIDHLLGGDVDMALCSTIDYQRSPEPLLFIPAGQLGCAGPTLTVRLYSRTPLSDVKTIWCDRDSHTSVVLMRVLMQSIYGVQPTLVDWDASTLPEAHEDSGWPDAMLLIGDKVVTNSPPAIRYPHQLDLGDAWMRTTGYPFVFAMWVARADADQERLRTIARILDRQRRFNMSKIDRLGADAARAHGWPQDLAAEYLGERLRFAVTDDALAGLTKFFDMARDIGAIDTARPVHCLDW